MNGKEPNQKITKDIKKFTVPPRAISFVNDGRWLKEGQMLQIMR